MFLVSHQLKNNEKLSNYQLQKRFHLEQALNVTTYQETWIFWFESSVFRGWLQTVALNSFLCGTFQYWSKKEDHKFERNEDRATVFLKWTDFKNLLQKYFHLLWIHLQCCYYSALQPRSQLKKAQKMCQKWWIAVIKTFFHT